MLNAARQLIVLYSFSGGADGGLPDAGVIRDAAGIFSGRYRGARRVEGLFSRFRGSRSGEAVRWG